jgi:hypothetical protein
MKVLGKLSVGCLFAISAISLLALPQFAASPNRLMQGMDQSAQAVDEPTPAFHAHAPQGGLPPTMAASLFSDTQTANAYAIASRIKKVLYQQPCYCHCDRSQGHGSLLDCYVSRHATGCDICQKENFYAYEQTHKSRTPAQIREGIMRGEWEKVDAAKYAKSLLAIPNAEAR